MQQKTKHGRIYSINKQSKIQISFIKIIKFCTIKQMCDPYAIENYTSENIQYQQEIPKSNY